MRPKSRGTLLIAGLVLVMLSADPAAAVTPSITTSAPSTASPFSNFRVFMLLSCTYTGSARCPLGKYHLALRPFYEMDLQEACQNAIQLKISHLC